MPNLFIMVGAPGSGKSHYLSKVVNDKCKIVSRDAVRFSMIKDEDEYFKAIEFFQNNSEFLAEEYDDEFRSISFFCSDQDDADVTENAIRDELDENGFSNFYFESEDEEDSDEVES